MPWGITGIFLAIVFAHGDGGAKKRRQIGFGMHPGSTAAQCFDQISIPRFSGKKWVNKNVSKLGTCALEMLSNFQNEQRGRKEP